MAIHINAYTHPSTHPSLQRNSHLFAPFIRTHVVEFRCACVCVIYQRVSLKLVYTFIVRLRWLVNVNMMLISRCCLPALHLRVLSRLYELLLSFGHCLLLITSISRLVGWASSYLRFRLLVCLNAFRVRPLARLPG